MLNYDAEDDSIAKQFSFFLISLEKQTRFPWPLVMLMFFTHIKI